MNKSFTLIEILVVIVVIGILSAFILVGMSSITSSANIARSQAFANSLNNALLLGRVSQWKLDESSVSTVYDSWGTNSGTLKENGYAGVCGLSNCPQIQTTGCVSGNCLSFDGINDYVDYINPASLSFGTGISFTIGVWIKRSDLSVHPAMIIGKGGGAGRYLIATDVSSILGIIKMNTYYGAGMDYWQTITANFKDTNWHHLLIVVDKTNLAQSVYYDGVKQGASVTIVNGDNTVASSFILGADSGTSSFFSGFIDDIRVYNAAMPTSQIQQNYFAGINKLLNNNGISLNEFNQRVVELKNNIVENE